MGGGEGVWGGGGGGGWGPGWRWWGMVGGGVRGVTVSLVARGWMPTGRHAGDTQEAKETYAAGVPMRNMGEARDVAEAVAYLASEGARFVTGQKISVNGGNTLA